MLKDTPQHKALFLSIFLILSFSLMFLSFSQPHLLINLREKNYFIGEFLNSLSSNLKMRLSDLVESISQGKSLQKENVILKRKMAELLFREKNYYPEIMASNHRLKALLGFKEKHPYKLTPVKLVAYSPMNFFKVIYIDKGAREGVRKGMGVVNAQGLVGKVIEVYSHQTKVLLVLDERSKIGVRVQRTQDIGILKGKGREGVCELEYLLTKANAEVGDEVVTSGLGGLFPEGILVGYISKIRNKPNYLFQEIEIIPSVDFGKLKEFFLVTQQ